jgi:hypothetical protein
MVERGQYATMAEHPDLVEMRERYERISSSPPTAITDGLLLVAGLWLAISPWVVHFRDTVPNVAQSNLLVGLVIAAVGLGLAMTPRSMIRLSWAASLIGVWVVVSPWAIQHSTVPLGVILTNAITGGVIILLGLAGTGITMAASRGRSAKRGRRESPYDDESRGSLTEQDSLNRGTDPRTGQPIDQRTQQRR